MNQIKVIPVGQTTYHVALASAVQQKALMSLIGTKIAINSAASKSIIDVPLLKGALTSLPESDLDRVSSIVLGQVFSPENPEKPVTIDDFQCRMNDYFSLMAEAIKENLGDFFTWLDSVNPGARPGPKKQNQQ